VLGNGPQKLGDAGQLLPRLFRPLRFNAMRKATIRWGTSTAAREIPIGIRWKQHSVRSKVA
jgi:hypothetical protein